MSAGLAGFARGLREMAPVGASFVDELAASQKVRDRSDRLAYADQVGKLEELKYKLKNSGSNAVQEFESLSPMAKSVFLSSNGIDPSVVGGMDAWKQRTGASKPAPTPEDTSATSSLASKIAQAYEPPAQQAATTQSVSSVSDSGGKQATYPVNQQDQGSLAQMTLNNAMRRKELDDRTERGTAKGDEARMRALISAGGGAEDVSMLSNMAGVSRSAVSDLRAENKDITGNRLGSAEKVFGTESQALAAKARELADIESAKVDLQSDLTKIEATGRNQIKVQGAITDRANNALENKNRIDNIKSNIDQIKAYESMRKNLSAQLNAASKLKGSEKDEAKQRAFDQYGIPTDLKINLLSADETVPNYAEAVVNKHIIRLQEAIDRDNRARDPNWDKGLSAPKGISANAKFFDTPPDSAKVTKLK